MQELPRNKISSGRTIGWFFLFILCVQVTVALGQQSDSLKVDSTSVASDTLTIADTTSNTMSVEQIRSPVRSPISEPSKERFTKLDEISSSNVSIEVTQDSLGNYVAQRKVMGQESGLPQPLSFEQYAEMNRQKVLDENWGNIIEQAQNRQQDNEGLLDFNIQIPGGEESAFATIFGKPQVDLSVNGTANMNIGASVQKTADPSVPPDQQTRVDPTFQQSLKLNISGTIGDKLNINTDWDTERDFDYQNRLNIVYEGYEDEIIKKIEMGNVSMDPGNSLVKGGGSLFGIKSIAELGPLRVTSVVSQQEGEGNTRTLEGGATEKKIEVKPADYEQDKHFFLDFYTRQEFEENISDPTQTVQTLQLQEVNVWVSSVSSTADEGARQAVALVDMGVYRNNNGDYLPPSNNQDAFDQATLDQFRDPAQGISASDFNVPSSEFAQGRFIPLQEGKDYEVDYQLGFISLKRNLSSRQALAVSYTYRPVGPNSQKQQVGELNRSSQDRIFLKMLRPPQMTTDNAAWPLTMRNIYSLGASDLSSDGTEINLQLTRNNVPESSLPGRTSDLLQDLGLDRVDNNDGSATPDNQIDFSTKTLDPANGLVMFPYLEPFGSRVKKLLEQGNLSGEELKTVIDNLAYEELYEQKVSDAKTESMNEYYLIDGTSKGGVSDNYFLGMALVEGSVKVYANGVQLQEGQDYEVDYSIGNITILNRQYLKSGQEIQIEYESNKLLQIEQKTFAGVRAQYNFTDDINLGGTYFNMKEQPLQDKIRIGDEPINNSVIGLDAQADFDLPWLTRLIDQVPLLQTKEPSSFNFSGEWAQLRPGVAQTSAVSDAIDQNRLFKDEEQGISFIDDFEGVQTTISFKSPGRWNLAAAPAIVPGYDPDQSFFGREQITPPGNTSDILNRSDLRAQFSWYTIPQNVGDVLSGSPVTPESEPVRVTDVFPGKEDVLPQEQFISTLDVHYDPTSRGPYNYNENLKNQLENNSEEMWGGMTATLPSGLEDLSRNNIEFLEFWVQPVLPGGRTPTAADERAYDGKIYIDMGVISEDVIPNFQLNSEDGLSERPEELRIDRNERSYRPSILPEPDGEFSNTSRELEDVGLDGGPNTGGMGGRNEQTLFQDFLNRMREVYGNEPEMLQEIVEDPSNDDYMYYGQSELDGLPRHERFYRMYGYHDGNTPQNQGDKRAVTNRPDGEGLFSPSNVETNNSYFEYELPLNPATINERNLATDTTFLVDKVSANRQTNRWYQIRIPVEEWKRKVGQIDNFQNISYIRMWMSGYERPFTLRFARFQLVGSQWRKAENVNQQYPNPSSFSVASINIEENGSRQPIPYRQPEGAIRAVDRGAQQQTLANEQAIVLGAEDLGPEDLRMVKKVYPDNLDLTNYSNMRMFVHGEGYKERGDAELVVRMGSDLENNYYEYRQPVTPTDPEYPFTEGIPSDNAVREEESKQIWKNDINGMNIVLSAFNQLKQLRNQQNNANISQPYTRSDVLENAPEGASVTIVGNPSLDRIGQIGLGIRNPFHDRNEPDRGTNSGNEVMQGVPNLSATFWLNELRVSGFDNKNGWKAQANAKLKLADFATINSKVQRTTDGYGSINSKLGSRQRGEETSYNISTSVNLHELIPDRFGWNIPVNFSVRQSIATPLYLPNQGDIRLSDFKKAIRTDDQLSEKEKQQRINEMVKQSQDYSEQYSFGLNNVSKSMSKNWLAKHTLDNLNYNFTYNDNFRHTPELMFRDSWNYNTSINYNLSFNQIDMLQPLDFLSEVPILGLTSGLRVGYMPSSISSSVDMTRNYEELRRRAAEGQSMRRLEQSHNFNYNTRFGFNYNLTKSISTSYQNNSSFSLANIAEVPDPGEAPADSNRYRVRSSTDVIKDVITSDTLSPRRKNYQENYSANWRPNLRKIPLFSWLSYQVGYSGSFVWQNTQRGSGRGANLQNSMNLDHSFSLNMQDILKKIPWYRNLRSADQQASRDRGSRRNNNRSGSNNGSGPESEGQAQEDGGLHLLETFKYYGRKTLLSALSMQSVDISYSSTQSSSQPAYAGEAQIYYAFNDPSDDHFAPPLSYRLGLDNQIDPSQIVPNPTESVEKFILNQNRTYGNELTLKTSLKPLNNLSVNLNWNASWDKSKKNEVYLEPGTNEIIDQAKNKQGNFNASVWAFGKGYEYLFRQQLSTAFEDIGDNLIINDELGNRDGETVLNRKSLLDDFREAYLGSGNSTIGEKNFMPVPLPNWRITWSGVEKFIPFVGEYISRASINHSYSGSYDMGWKYIPDPGQRTRSLGQYSVEDIRPQNEPNQVTVQKSFSPLIGISMTWENQLQTNVEYSYSERISLSLSNTSINENINKSIKITSSYTFDDFRLPFMETLKNDVDLSINGSYTDQIKRRYSLNADVSGALSTGPDELVKDPSRYEFSPRDPTGRANIRGSTVIGYRFSNTIKANFEYGYNKLLPRSSGSFERTEHDITFNIQVSIRSN